MNQSLTCQHDGHTWTRVASRGRKPAFCPKHDPRQHAASVSVSATASTEIETLTCQHGGHTWERPRVRGRKPPFCPEHRPVIAVSTASEGASALSADLVRPLIVQRVLGLKLKRNSVPGASNALGELQSKLQYTVRELENPAAWREPADWDGSGGIIETHKRLVREADGFANLIELQTEGDLALV